VGVYTILDLLPWLGIKTDILLTTDEESCRSSAQVFKSTKKYNWMVEFDRMGDDVVTYGMDTVGFRDAIDAAKMIHNFGSYSDICDLDELGCCALNVGVGYHDPHSIRAHMFVREYVHNMKKFVKFYWKNKDISYPLPKPERNTKSKSTKHRWFQWDGYDDDDRDAYIRPSTMIGDRTELNELTGTVVHQDQQRCPDCGLSLDYIGSNIYACWVCDKEFEYDFNSDRLVEFNPLTGELINDTLGANR
jgi:hypothetical protein